MNKSLAVLFLAVVILLSAGVGYLFWQNQKLSSSIDQQMKTAVSPQPTTLGLASPLSSPVESVSPSPLLSLALTENAIKTNINAKNYQGLVPYMTTPKVNFAIMSTECCQPQTPTAVIDQLKYINDGVPFDFNQESDLVKNLKAKNPQLADFYIGISQSKEHLVAFKINSNNQIFEIQVSVTYKLYSM